MSGNAVERIRHYNNLLIQQHKFVGGTILRGYGLYTRIFAWKKGRDFYAWGADYTPLPEGRSWFDRLITRNDCDDELGLPGTAVCEAWLSIAENVHRATTVRQFEYSTGAIGGLDPHVAFVENRLDAALADVRVDHVRGGLGYMRGIPEFPQITTDVDRIEELATALRSAASIVIARSE